jgi:hypothetical protein
MSVSTQVPHGRPPVTVIACDGCHRRVSSDLGLTRTRELIAWTRDDERDWCLLCSGRRGVGTPVATRRTTL